MISLPSIPACRLVRYFALLLTLMVGGVRSLGADVTLMPIPNQVVYIGGPPLWVPVVVQGLTGTENVAMSVIPNARSAYLKLVVLTTPGGRFLQITPPREESVNTLSTPISGNTPVTIVAVKGGITNQITFALNLLRPDFAVSRTYPTLAGSATPHWADFDGSGTLDFLGGSTLGVRQNTGQTFGSLLANFPGLGGLSVLPADINGDGRMDFVAFGGRGGVSLHLQTGGVNYFSRQDLDLVPIQISDAVWVDLDADGRLDLVLTGAIPGPVLQYRNRGGALTRVTSDLPAASGPVLATDFDGDGFSDLLLFNTGLNQHTSVLFLNDGTGGFVASGTVLPEGEVVAAGWTDFNGDGVPDVWLQVRTRGPGTSLASELILLQQENGAFRQILQLPASVMGETGPPVWGDFDHDGTPDFIAPAPLASRQLQGNQVVALSLYPWMIYHNDGAGHFRPDGFVSLTVGTHALSVADIDGDGALDLTVPGANPNPGPVNLNTVMLNPNRPVNLAPSAPESLHAFVLGTNIIFFWNEAFDPNQTAKLTYNIRVGSRPGANDVIASMSRLDGTRMLPAPGNAAYATLRILRLPRVDTDVLYWSVQAVDNSFVGSPFAPEQILSVSYPNNQPPVIAGFTNRVMTEDSTLLVPFNVTDDLTRPTSLNVSVIVANTGLFPAGSVQVLAPVRDSDPFRLRLQPAPTHFGTSELMIVASDHAGAATTNRFVVVVTHVNHLPSLVVETAPAGRAGIAQSTSIVISDLDGDSLTLTSRVLPGNTLELAGVVISGAGTNRLVTVTPASSSVGSVTLELTLDDGAGGVVRETVTFHFEAMAFYPVVERRIANPGAHQQIWADLDGDGVMELIHSPAEYPAERLEADAVGVQIETWKSGQWISAGTVGGTDALWVILAAADFDHDGRVDLFGIQKVQDQYGNNSIQLRVFRNLGDFQFEPMPWSSIAWGLRTAQAVDLDGDGWVDLLLQYPDHSEIVLNRQGTYNGDREILTGSQPYLVLDLNGDGIPELVGEVSEIESVVWQWRSGRYEMMDTAWLGGRILGMSDFNLDQHPDLLIRGRQSSTLLQLGTTNGYSAPVPLGLLRLDPPLILADFNQDGRADIMSAGFYGISLGENLATANFLSQRTSLDELRLENPSAADFDGDGVMDLAGGLNVLSSERLEIYRGSSLRTNHPPSAPKRLRTLRVRSGEVQLGWDVAADLDQSGGLTYNLRVGTAPGLGDVVAAESRSDGRRLVAREGNAGWALNRGVHRLISGQTYYWSVQAVDNSYTGGPFAPEGTFEIPFAPIVTGAMDERVIMRLSGEIPAIILPLQISHPTLPPTQVRLQAVSSNLELLESAGVVVEGVGASRVLKLFPRRGQTGDGVVTLSAEDDLGGELKLKIFVTVLPVPTPSVGITPSFDFPADRFPALSLDDFDTNHVFVEYVLTQPPARGSLQGNLPHVIYTPTSGFTGLDVFTFLAQAIDGRTLSARVTLIVRPPAGPATLRLALPERTAMGDLELSVTGSSIPNWRLETSADLLHWRPAPVIPPSGRISFATPATNYQEFFRIRWNINE